MDDVLEFNPPTQEDPQPDANDALDSAVEAGHEPVEGGLVAGLVAVDEGGGLLARVSGRVVRHGVLSYDRSLLVMGARPGEDRAGRCTVQV